MESRKSRFAKDGISASAHMLYRSLAPFILSAPLLAPLACQHQQAKQPSVRQAQVIGSRSADAGGKEKAGPSCDIRHGDMDYSRNGRTVSMIGILNSEEKVAEVVCRDKNLLVRTDKSLVVVNFPALALPLGNGQVGFTNFLSFSFDISDIVPKMVGWTYSADMAFFLTNDAETKDRQLIARTFSPADSRRIFRVPADPEGASIAYSDGVVYILFKNGHLMASAPGKPDYYLARIPQSVRAARLFEKDGMMMIGEPGKDEYRIRVGADFQSLDFVRDLQLF